MTESTNNANDNPLQPMTPRLMGRLFIVPALIVVLLLAVSVVVVLFGTTTTDKQETLSDLIARLEADPGEKTLGTMLLPAAKESWQAAQELARRLEKRDEFLRSDEIDPTADRLIAILNRFPIGRDTDEPASAQQYFIMMALARLESQKAVDPLSKLLKDPNWATRRTAVQSLAMMPEIVSAGPVVPDIAALLNDPIPAVRIVACGALAVLAQPGDTATIRLLADRLSDDREVQWNAAMALAHLESSSGKLVLLNMLDRSYWEGIELQYMENGVQVTRKFAPAEVERNLQSAIAASVRLSDPELDKAVAALEADHSTFVRDAARSANQSGHPKVAPADSSMHAVEPRVGPSPSGEGEDC